MNLIHRFASAGIDLETQVPLDRYTYIKIGGPAQYLYRARDTDNLVLAAKLAWEHQLPLTVLGGGSNVVISDQGIKGLVILDRTSSINFLTDNLVTAASGVVLSRLVHSTIDRGLSGLEHFLGVPGTVGGAVYNNAHFRDHFIGASVTSVASLTPPEKVHHLTPADCRFAYDSSIFQTSAALILSATFKLKPQDPDNLRQVARQALDHRRLTQPLAHPSSGCFFKNVASQVLKSRRLSPQHTSAGYLIDQAGLKGTTVGGAQVSPQHANFIINTGTATAKDIKDLSQLIIDKVRKAFQITLEIEVFFLGE